MIFIDFFTGVPTNLLETVPPGPASAVRGTLDGLSQSLLSSSLQPIGSA